MELIPLINSILAAIVDDDDAIEIRRYKWRLLQVDKKQYAVTGKMILMHRVILGVSKGGNEVDHKSGDGLDNQRLNLRLVSHAQQMQNRLLHKNNRSGARGVYWSAKFRRWIGQVKLNGKKVFNRTFVNFDDAVYAVREARKSFFTHSIEH